MEQEPKRSDEDELTATMHSAGSLVGRECGPYRIVSPLGAGGMGQVYRAHDSKLGRDVAIKTLPAEFARNPERLARFRREARTLASLNHPNIGAIYGLEESEGVDCLVLELVEGEALRGPLPVATVLERADQVAEALEAAHAKGIIHRDLKPANVKVTPEGRVKVLDFGLAKALWGPEPNHGHAETETVTGIETVVGHVVGTPGYMSPEQARGQEVDERTDVWAFGCLLYELLTGKRAFQAENTTETLAAVLEREPDWRALPANAPAKIRELLRQCLQKNINRRPAKIADVRRIITETRGRRSRWRVAAVAVAALALLAIGGALWLRAPARPADRSQWVQLTKFPDSVCQPALSPDGRMVTFIRSDFTFVGPGQVYVKILPDGDPVQLTHDDNPKMSPVFSPDGTRVAYTLIDQELHWDTWVVPVLGGEPQRLLRNAAGLTWNGPRQVLFSEIKMGDHMGLVTAEESRANQREVYLPADEFAMAHRSYQSPDGKWVLLVEMDIDHLWEPCRVVPADGSSPGRKVGPPGGGCTFGAWSPDGKWIYLTSNAVGGNHIWRQRFPDGQPELITPGPTEEEGIAMAPDGRSFITAMALANTSLWVHDASGERQISLEGNPAQPRYTPDGKKLLCRIVNEAPNELLYFRDLGEVRVVDLKSGRSEPLVRGFRALDYDISPDGREVVMETADQQGKPQLWLTPLDRSSPPRQIPNVEGGSPRFGLAGEIYYRALGGNSKEERGFKFLYRVRRDGTGIERVTKHPIAILEGVSPDGKWVVAFAPVPGKTALLEAVPLDGGEPLLVGGGDFGWLPGAAWFGSLDGHSTYIVPLAQGRILPPIPEGGFKSDDELAKLPGARKVDAQPLFPGPSPDVYAFYRGATQRNLYRIPIP
jgi:serine/threonine protein kinase